VFVSRSVAPGIGAPSAVCTDPAATPVAPEVEVAEVWLAVCHAELAPHVARRIADSHRLVLRAFCPRMESCNTGLLV